MQKRAEALVDTPNSVLRRLLKLNAGRQRIRSARGKGITPQGQYRKPILETLKEMGGSGRIKNVLNKVHEKMKPVLKSVDYEKTSTGELRWKNYACWERLKMVKEGLLRGNSPRGVWELSEKGREELERLK